MLVLYRYENLRKVRTNMIGVTSLKWRKYALFRKYVELKNTL